MSDGFSSKYMFSIEAGFSSRWVGETPAGHRIDLDFTKAAGDTTIKTTLVRALSEHRDEIFKWTQLRASNDEKWAKELESWPLVRALIQPGNQHVPSDTAALNTQANGFLKSVETFLENEANQDVVPPWFGFTGKIVSGMDWALLRADGVIEFDGRLTLSDRPNLPPEQRVLVNAQTSGAVDLMRPDEERPRGLDQAAEVLRSENGPLGVALALRFESPQRPQPWAAKRYTRSKGQLRYAALSRGQFLGVGTLSDLKAATSKLTLDIFKVVPPPVQNATSRDSRPPRAKNDEFTAALIKKLQGDLSP